MHLNFCTKCGGRFGSDARFCPGCGARIEESSSAADERSSATSPSLKRLPELLPESITRRGVPDGLKPVFTLSPKDLNLIVNYSLMNAPLDTAFLMILTKITKSWIPLSFFNTMEGFGVTGAGRVLYVVDEKVDEFCYPNEARLHHSPIGVISGFEKNKEGPFTEIQIFLRFKPLSYGAIDGDIRGKWATVLDDRGVQDVRAVLQMPLSGECMRHRLIEHWFFLTEEVKRLEKTDDSPDQYRLRYPQSRLAALSQILDKVPDAHPDHIYCIASVLHRGRLQNTAVADAETSPRLRSGVGAGLLEEFEAWNASLPQDLRARERTLRILQASGLRIAAKSTGQGPPTQARQDLRSDI